MRMLRTHAPAIFSVIVFFLSTVDTYMICLRFRFDPLTRAFSNRYVFDENAQRKGAWTEGLNISKCMRFWEARVAQ